MTASSLNVCAGIDAGSSSSKLAYSDNLGTRIIAVSEGFDFLTLREEAEIFFDDMISSCVIAVNDGLTSRQRNDFKLRAKEAGFSDSEIITADEAIMTVIDGEKRTIVCDLGASATRMFVIERDGVIDSASVDVCGNMFDEIFVDYLTERRLLKENDTFILSEAKRIKHILSENESRLWHNMNIMKEDFERLIYFPVKRASHTFNRLRRVMKPERIILTGGCAKIPLVQKFFVSQNSETIDGLIVKGTAIKALGMSKQSVRQNKPDTVTKIREIRAEILRLEDSLTRQQKDRLYILFKQTEGMNDTGMITMMENLLRDLRDTKTGAGT